MKKRERYEELLLGLGPKFSALAAACFAEQAPPPPCCCLGLAQPEFSASL